MSPMKKIYQLAQSIYGCDDDETWRVLQAIAEISGGDGDLAEQAQVAALTSAEVALADHVANGTADEFDVRALAEVTAALGQVLTAGGGK